MKSKFLLVGAANLTISVSDGILTTVRTLRLSVSSQNDAPVITPIQDQVIPDGQSGRVSFSILDDSDLANLTLSVKSSDDTLLPASALKINGSGTDRALDIAPVAGVLGLATITLTATDGQFTTRSEFLVSVEGANSTPRISRIANVAVGLNGQSSLIAFSVFDRETAPSNLKVQAASSNPQLLKSASIAIGGFGNERTLLLAPELGQTGIATVTLSVSDGERTSTQSFQVLVEKVELTITGWASATDHGPNVGEMALSIPDTDAFAESRLTGIHRLLVTFSTAVNPASLNPARFGVTGLNANNSRIDLGGITWTTSLRDDNQTAVIEFSRPLPELAKYRVALSSVTTPGGTQLTGDRDRVLTALPGDIDGDLRITVADAKLVRAARGVGVISANSSTQIRGDLNADGRVNNLDLGGALRLPATDLRSIARPPWPINVLPPLPGEIVAKAFPVDQSTLIFPPVELFASAIRAQHFTGRLQPN